MGLEINIRDAINLALPLVCLCPLGACSIRVESQCCLAANKDRRHLFDGYVPKSTKNSERHENGGFAERFMGCLSILEDVEKTGIVVDLKQMFI